MKRTDITALFPEATKEQIDKLMDLNGEDINKAKGDLETIRGQLATAQTEIQNLKAQPGADAAKVTALQQELDALKAANTLRDLREKVSKETGVPASLLTGENEDACKAQAESIKAYAKQTPGYPTVPDGGEAGSSKPGATRDQFADWFAKAAPANTP